jgi:predicted nucleic acid-binding Zn ribbon protein
MAGFEQAVNDPDGAVPMNSLRDSLPKDFLGRMQKELGREEMLRLVWPMIVGSKLGGSAQFHGIRRNTLRVGVPDQTWKNTLRSMENMILERVHRFCGEDVGRAIEFVESPRPVPPSQKKSPAARPLPPVDLPLDAIADPQLRQMFDLSARKYFARMENSAR